MIEGEIVLMMQFDGTQQRALGGRKLEQSFSEAKQFDKLVAIKTRCHCGWLPGLVALPT